MFKFLIKEEYSSRQKEVEVREPILTSGYLLICKKYE